MITFSKPQERPWRLLQVGWRRVRWYPVWGSIDAWSEGDLASS